MKDYRLDALIAAANPKQSTRQKQFTDAVMGKLESSEILSSHVRKMDVNKKETFIMKIRHLPKLAIIAVAIGALVLLSTGAYATYKLLWSTPQVEVSESTTSVSGRQEVSLSFKNCDERYTANRYELKRNATITVDQVADVVKAQCELQAIDAWAQAEFPNDRQKAPEQMGSEPYERTEVYTGMATHIASRDDNSITFAGLEKYGGTDETLDATSDVQYIANGAKVEAGVITNGDPIVYIVSTVIRMTPEPGCNDKHCSTSGVPVKKTLLAVVKLNLSFESYDQLAWQSLTERSVCYGNEEDTCLTGYIGGIDLYMDYSKTQAGYMSKEIQGVITEINGKTVTIRSSSGTLFTITTPRDIVADFNTNKSHNYNDRKVEVGNSLGVRYSEPENEHSKALTADQINYVSLQIEMVSKGDVPDSY